MRSQILIVLLAATASARPVAQPDSNGVENRELQYSEIEALYAERSRAHDKVEARELQYSEIEDLYMERDAHKHKPGHDHHEGSHSRPHGDVWQPHGPPHDGEPFPHDDHHRGDGPHGHHHHEFEEFGHPHDHHHGGPHNDILDNIIGFLTHNLRRSVPDAPSRVLDGIRDFLSHETRDVHEHEGHRRHHPHGEHEVGRNILDFFASAAR